MGEPGSLDRWVQRGGNEGPGGKAVPSGHQPWLKNAKNISRTSHGCFFRSLGESSKEIRWEYQRVVVSFPAAFIVFQCV